MLSLAAFGESARSATHVADFGLFGQTAAQGRGFGRDVRRAWPLPGSVFNQSEKKAWNALKVILLALP
jgi:hypothetical protein